MVVSRQATPCGGTRLGVEAKWSCSRTVFPGDGNGCDPGPLGSVRPASETVFFLIYISHLFSELTLSPYLVIEMVPEKRIPRMLGASLGRNEMLPYRDFTCGHCIRLCM